MFYICVNGPSMLRRTSIPFDDDLHGKNRILFEWL